MKNEGDLSRVYPVILQYIAPYHQVYKGKVSLGNILSGANKDMKDFPTLEGYTDSNGGVHFALLGVWVSAHMLRKRGHVAKERTTLTFAS